MEPVFAFTSRIIGIEPRMSMMAKSTMKVARISRRLRCIDVQYLVWPANIELS
jgi:hypothetical protein